MNKDIVEGKIKQAEGKAEDKLGQITDSPEHEAKGKLKQVEGHIQEGVGKIKNAAKDAAKDLK